MSNKPIDCKTNSNVIDTAKQQSSILEVAPQVIDMMKLVMQTGRSENDKVTKRIAILIDSENAYTMQIPKVVKQAEEMGYIVYKKVYGDFSRFDMKEKWRECCQEYFIAQGQSFQYNIFQEDKPKGKSNTDMLLAIDAMQLLKDNVCDIYFIVSSDIDYYVLVETLRKNGKRVYGYVDISKVSKNNNIKNIYDSIFETNMENEINKIIVNIKKIISEKVSEISEIFDKLNNHERTFLKEYCNVFFNEKDKNSTDKNSKYSQNIQKLFNELMKMKDNKFKKEFELKQNILSLKR